MTPDFLQAALEEFYRLEVLLRANPDFQRHEALRRAIALYTPEAQSIVPLDPLAHRIPSATKTTLPTPGPTSSTLTPPTYPDPSPRSRAGRYTWTNSQQSRIREAAAAHMKQTGHRQTGGQIYKAILSKGVEVQGKKPAAVVSAALTSSPDFDHITRQGYGLAEWSNANGKS